MLRNRMQHHASDVPSYPSRMQSEKFEEPLGIRRAATSPSKISERKGKINKVSSLQIAYKRSLASSESPAPSGPSPLLMPFGPLGPALGPGPRLSSTSWSALRSVVGTDEASAWSFEGSRSQSGLQFGTAGWDAVGGFGIGVGEYRVVREVGRGAQAVVFEVQDEEGAHKAMKVIDLQSSVRNFARKLKSVDREVRILKRLNWASSVVVPLYESWIAADFSNATIIMEFLPVSLAALLKDRRSNGEAEIDNDTASQFLSQLAAGLAAIHEAGAIHRDVKPENILIVERGGKASGDLGCKLADFGVGRLLMANDEDDLDSQGQSSPTYSSSLSSTPAGGAGPGGPLSKYMPREPNSLTMAVGSWGYASPELLSSGVYSSAVDIYALGSVVLEMLTYHNAWTIHDDDSKVEDKDLPSPLAPEADKRQTPLARASEAFHNTLEYFKKQGLVDSDHFSKADAGGICELVVIMLSPDSSARPTATEIVCQPLLHEFRRRLLSDFPELLRVTHVNI